MIAGANRNVGLQLSRAAVRRPDADAIIAPDGVGWRRLSFRELDEWTSRIADGLRQVGITKGTRTLLLVKAGVDLIGVTYGLFKAGAVPVLIDPGMGRAMFLRCVEQLAPEAFVGIPLGHVARLLNPRAFRSVKVHVTVGTRWLWGGESLAGLAARGDASAPAADVGDADEAAVLFTSGSTGPAKGVVYTHGIFNAQVEELRSIYGFRPGEIDCAAFPLFSLFDNALEMTSVIPELDPSRPGTCDPAKVVRALTEHRCTTAFGSPAIWRRVAPWAREHHVQLPELRRILIAGASVPPPLIEALHGLMPDGEVGTPYGATESLPVAHLGGREILDDTRHGSARGAGTCVGRPAPGIRVAILPVTDEVVPTWDEGRVLPDGEVGEIVVKGPVVTRAYAALPEATAAAKIAEGDAVWHRVGDLGHIDPLGRLWFCGRKSERVETAAGTVYTDCVEGLLAPLAEGRRVALVGRGERGREEPVLWVEGPEDDALRAALLAWRPTEPRPATLRHFEGLREVRFQPQFPVDVRHNAKIHRGQLKGLLPPSTP